MAFFLVVLGKLTLPLSDNVTSMVTCLLLMARVLEGTGILMDEIMNSPTKLLATLVTWWDKFNGLWYQRFFKLIETGVFYRVTFNPMTQVRDLVGTTPPIRMYLMFILSLADRCFPSPFAKRASQYSSDYHFFLKDRGTRSC